MADFRDLCSAADPNRSSRPRPLSFRSILAFLTCAGCLSSCFSLPAGGAGGGGNTGSEDAEGASVKALLAPSEDNLHCSSSRDSSSSMGANSPTGAEGSHAPTENYMGTNLYGRTVPMEVANNSANNPAVKGLLAFINTIAEKMLLFYFGLVTFSLAYPLGQKAARSFDDPWVRVICTGSVISSFGSCIMAAFASHFKESESIDHVRFEIFIWLLFLELVAFIAEFCITLHVFARISNWVVWPFGITGFCFVVLTWVVYLERPKFLNKWTKEMWEKMGCYLRGPTPGLPRPPI